MRPQGSARLAVLSFATLGTAAALGAVATPAFAAGSAAVSAADTARVHHYAGELHKIRMCESGGNYRINTGNGYYGAYQFAAATWHGLGYRGLPNQAAPSVQDAAAAKLLARSGTRSWSTCG